MKRIIDVEEALLVNRGIESEMQEIREGKIKTKCLGQLKKKYML